VREGLQIAIVGKPNVGKSSVFNALAGASRAIVTDVPGTTRDLVTETIDLDGLRATLVDTAGLRSTTTLWRLLAWPGRKQAHAVADLTLLVLDRSLPLDADDREAISQTIDRIDLSFQTRPICRRPGATGERRGGVRFGNHWRRTGRTPPAHCGSARH